MEEIAINNGENVLQNDIGLRNALDNELTSLSRKVASFLNKLDEVY